MIAASEVKEPAEAASNFVETNNEIELEPEFLVSDSEFGNQSDCFENSFASDDLLSSNNEFQMSCKSIANENYKIFDYTYKSHLSAQTFSSSIHNNKPALVSGILQEDLVAYRNENKKPVDYFVSNKSAQNMFQKPCNFKKSLNQFKLNNIEENKRKFQQSYLRMPSLSPKQPAINFHPMFSKLNNMFTFDFAKKKDYTSMDSRMKIQALNQDRANNFSHGSISKFDKIDTIDLTI